MLAYLLDVPLAVIINLQPRKSNARCNDEVKTFYRWELSTLPPPSLDYDMRILVGMAEITFTLHIHVPIYIFWKNRPRDLFRITI